MRVTYALQGLLTASTVIAASYNPRYIVLGTDGTVVVDADPSLYFRTGVSHFFEDHDQLEDVVACDLVSKQPEVDEVSMVLLPSIDNDLLTVHDITSDQVHFDIASNLVVLELTLFFLLQDTDEDDFSSTAPPVRADLPFLLRIISDATFVFVDLGSAHVLVSYRRNRHPRSVWLHHFR